MATPFLLAIGGNPAAPGKHWSPPQLCADSVNPSHSTLLHMQHADRTHCPGLNRTDLRTWALTEYLCHQTLLRRMFERKALNLGWRKNRQSHSSTTAAFDGG